MTVIMVPMMELKDNWNMLEPLPDDYLRQIAAEVKEVMEGGVEGLKERKRLIAQDTNKDNPTYSLEDRKSMVGGCWVNYDEDSFKKWFEGRTK